MWAAIKARLRGRAPEPAASAASSSTGAATGARPSASAPEFADGWLGTKVDDDKLGEVLDDLEIVLLQSDVALPVVERMRRDVKKQLAGRKLKWGTDVEEAIRASLMASVRGILDKPVPDLVANARAYSPKPYTILFVGVNGTGKTTTVAKLAHLFRQQGLGVVIAAGDTFRAGAIEQLIVHGEKLGIRVVRQQEGSDPAAVAYDALEHARAKGLDAVLVDTAGRQHTNENLIEEAKKIRRVVQPQFTVFVGDALSGNDVVEQAKLFQSALGIDALILTKLDADAKGGAALSTAFVTGKPIAYVGLGQGYSDLKRFQPDWMVERLFAEAAPA